MFAHYYLSAHTLQVSDDDNHDDDEEEIENESSLNQERNGNKRKCNRSQHSIRNFARNNIRPCKMFKGEFARKRKSQPNHKKSSSHGTGASPFTSLGSNLSIMTSGLEGANLTPQAMAAAAAASPAPHPNSTLPGTQSPQLTQAAFAAATAALATAATAAGMPVNQLITQVSTVN